MQTCVHASLWRIIFIRNMKARITFVFILFFSSFFMVKNAQSQGCVAIRNMSCTGDHAMINGNTTSILNKGEFQVLAGYRHFKSFRHFRGKHEEPNRVEEGTEVINYFNSFDLGLSYSATSRLALTVVLPLTFNDRSSLYEHYGNSIESNPDRKRFHTNSAGIGDLRLSASYWMLNPAKYAKGNFALGLGIKIPTGNEGVPWISPFSSAMADGESTSRCRAIMLFLIKPMSISAGFTSPTHVKSMMCFAIPVPIRRIRTAIFQ
jgi:hypothetical protein